jgi:hypothetical protein
MEERGVDGGSGGVEAGRVSDPEGVADAPRRALTRQERRLHREMAAWIRSRRGYDESEEFRARWEPIAAAHEAKSRRRQV